MSNSNKRLNIAIDAELHKKLKVAAAKNGTTIVAIVSDGINKKLKELEKGETSNEWKNQTKYWPKRFYNRL